jgi:hypothetical protein
MVHVSHRIFLKISIKLHTCTAVCTDYTMSILNIQNMNSYVACLHHDYFNNKRTSVRASP